MDLLIYLHRNLQRTVDVFGLRPVAQMVFRSLLRFRYGQTGLVRSNQNGRNWLLEQSVALRGADAEFCTVQWLRDNVNHGQTVIDVGANVGQMTLEMAQLVGENGKVIAIEPASGNLALLKRHVESNGFLNRVNVVAAACGNKHGTSVDFRIFGNDLHAIGSGFHLSGFEEKGQWMTITVPVVSIDEICKDGNVRPSVIKIDVEGAELLVLQGATHTLSTAKPAIRFGFHPFAFKDPVNATSEIRDLLHRHSYRMSDEVSECLKLEEYDAFFCG